MLLIHGAHVAGSFLTIMDEPALADFSLIRYHRRGYAGSAPADGESGQWIASAAADAAALLRHLGVDRAHVVGHSSGAAIALQLAGLISAWFAGSEDSLVPGVNHALHMKDPAAVAVAIAEFANRHPIE